MTPAFKEWQVIVDALVAGEQTLILRKGGISEGQGGFQVQAERFWLFPTAFHAQRDRTKPEAARWFPADSDPASAGMIPITAFADVVAATFLSDWAAVARLDPFHFWLESVVRERFAWAQPPGIHALLVRVHRLTQPVLLKPTAEMAGCKSWTELPLRFEDHPAEPVLSDDAFATARALIGL